MRSIRIRTVTPEYVFQRRIIVSCALVPTINRRGQRRRPRQRGRDGRRERLRHGRLRRTRGTVFRIDIRVGRIIIDVRIAGRTETRVSWIRASSILGTRIAKRVERLVVTVIGKVDRTIQGGRIEFAGPIYNDTDSFGGMIDMDRSNVRR